MSVFLVSIAWSPGTFKGHLEYKVFESLTKNSSFSIMRVLYHICISWNTLKLFMTSWTLVSMLLQLSGRPLVCSLNPISPSCGNFSLPVTAISGFKGLHSVLGVWKRRFSHGKGKMKGLRALKTHPGYLPVVGWQIFIKWQGRGQSIVIHCHQKSTYLFA